MKAVDLGPAPAVWQALVPLGLGPRPVMLPVQAGELSGLLQAGGLVPASAVWQAQVRSRLLLRQAVMTELLPAARMAGVLGPARAAPVQLLMAPVMAWAQAPEPPAAEPYLGLELASAG